MLSAKEAMVIHEALLSSPGMNDTVKIDLRFPRKNILLVVRLIQLGLAFKNQSSKGDLVHMMTDESEVEINESTIELLRKAGLTELYDKLNSLNHE